MPRFAANLSMLFTEVPMLERFERAARAGFTAVELQFPYDWPATAIADRLHEHRLRLVLHNLPAGDFAGGDRGVAADSARVDEFRAGLRQGVAYAQVLGVRQLNCLAGRLAPGGDGTAARRTLVSNLRHAADELGAAGIRLLVEPLNPHDVPGYVLPTPTAALAVLDEVGSDNVALQYDVYHAQRAEGELAGTLQRALLRIGHVQVADNPGRHEPGSGEIAWGYLFSHLHRIGYRGDIGCEYAPAAGTEAGLGWLAQARRLLAGG